MGQLLASASSQLNAPDGGAVASSTDQMDPHQMEIDPHPHQKEKATPCDKNGAVYSSSGVTAAVPAPRGLKSEVNQKRKQYCTEEGGDGEHPPANKRAHLQINWP
jgi:hypothetical protein